MQQLIAACAVVHHKKQKEHRKGDKTLYDDFIRIDLIYPNNWEVIHAQYTPQRLQ